MVAVSVAAVAVSVNVAVPVSVTVSVGVAAVVTGLPVTNDFVNAGVTRTALVVTIV